MSAFFYNYAGRILNTCGTGAAKGTIADGCWQKNAGNEFVMIWNPRDIQAGDIAVYSTGQWGHIGMAMGGYNNGYFALLGQNQGGRACPGGGAAGNIINLSTRDFIGAFRPKAYIKPEPKPEPEPTPEPTPAPAEDTYTVRKGDTLGDIAYKLGWYTGKKMFGDDGYAQSLAEFNGIKNRGIIYPGQVIKRK
ncbi:MAG: LysM domain-containing protein [Candidatus Saccharimonadaceae bacterium]|nr:LysM domain-containing protein [Candidatus Saccharimonadaceae bacterium]